MRLWLVSDLHTNHAPWSPALVPEHDVMVIAGDLSRGLFETLTELDAIQRNTRRPVVLVPGNHDPAGDDLDCFAKARSGDDVHVLSSGQAVVINGVRFVGATLWTDWWLNDAEFASQAWAARHMPEYQSVTRDGGEPLWPIHTSSAHDRQRHAIKQALSQRHEGPTVVVTHHAPSGKSLGPGGLIGVEGAAYASDLEDLILRYRPALWVHGHIHSASDYWLGGTRILCNPRGYQRPDWSENSGWIEDLVVQV